MSDYSLSVTVNLGGRGASLKRLRHVTAVAETLLDLSTLVDLSGIDGEPTWQVDPDRPDTVYFEGQSRWIDNDLPAWQRFASTLGAKWSGLSVTVSEEWRGDGEPFARVTVLNATGNTVEPRRARLGVTFERILAQHGITPASVDLVGDLVDELADAAIEVLR